MSELESIDQAVEKRAIDYGSRAAQLTDEARAKHREAAECLLLSGLPSEVHAESMEMVRACDSHMANIGQHIRPVEEEEA